MLAHLRFAELHAGSDSAMSHIPQATRAGNKEEEHDRMIGEIELDLRVRLHHQRSLKLATEKDMPSIEGRPLVALGSYATRASHSRRPARISWRFSMPIERPWKVIVLATRTACSAIRYLASMVAAIVIERSLI